MSKRARHHSCLHRVAASARGAGRGANSPAGAGLAIAAGSEPSGFAGTPRCSNRNRRYAIPNSARATPVHTSRLATNTPVSDGSIVLRSAAVQHLVVTASADSPNGSAIERACAAIVAVGQTGNPRRTNERGSVAGTSAATT